VVKLKL
jgi:hypothetical protein